MPQVPRRRDHGHLSTVNTTQHHRFWDDTTENWVDAADLAIGHKLHNLDGHVVTVAGISLCTHRQWMYDLTVDEIHTYYLLSGDTSILVHNCSAVGSGAAAEAAGDAASAARGGVYTLRDGAGNVVRTGRGKDLAARERAHFNDPELGDYRFNVEYWTDV